MVPSPHDPHSADAADAGLRWVSDDSPGIRRIARRDGFAYVDARGRPIRRATELQRIRRLAIPPAYRDVWICPQANGHLQATGRDARGRKQYRYHPDWQARRSATKFASLARFGQGLPVLRDRIRRELASGETPTRERVLATLVRLLDTTWLRIGNDAYLQQNGSYGLTTLRRRHAAVEGAALRLRFVGKSGVKQALALDDERVARIVRRCQELPGQQLFQYLDDAGEVHRMGSADVNTWLADTAGDAISAKDFRTWHGSVLALQLLLAYRFERADATHRTPLPEVIAAVAQRLGNTPAVCRKAYIHPAVLAVGEALGDEASLAALRAERWVTAPPRRRGLNLAERQLLGLLRKRGTSLAATPSPAGCRPAAPFNPKESP